VLAYNLMMLAIAAVCLAGIHLAFGRCATACVQDFA
jgi:hypothetical protein